MISERISSVNSVPRARAEADPPPHRSGSPESGRAWQPYRAGARNAEPLRHLRGFEQDLMGALLSELRVSLTRQSRAQLDAGRLGPRDRRRPRDRHGWAVDRTLPCRARPASGPATERAPIKMAIGNADRRAMSSVCARVRTRPDRLRDPSAEPIRVCCAGCLAAALALAWACLGAPPANAAGPQVTVTVHQASGAPASYFTLSGRPGRRARGGSLEVHNPLPRA